MMPDIAIWRALSLRALVRSPVTFSHWNRLPNGILTGFSPHVRKLPPPSAATYAAGEGYAFNGTCNWISTPHKRETLQ